MDHDAATKHNRNIVRLRIGADGIAVVKLAGAFKRARSALPWASVMPRRVPLNPIAAAETTKLRIAEIKCLQSPPKHYPE